MQLLSPALLHPTPPKPSGAGLHTLYLLTNRITGKKYAGQTTLTFAKRMKRNGSGYRNSKRLYNSIEFHGAENFFYTVLGYADTQEEADRKEQEYMDLYDTRNPEKGYNTKDAGSNGPHSEETKKKISQSMMGREVSPETREKSRQAQLGIPKAPHTEEWKRENGARTKERHAIQGHPMQGKQHTPETKAKISANQTGKPKPRTPETLAKQAAVRKAKLGPQSFQDTVITDYLARISIQDIMQKYDFKNPRRVYDIMDANNIPRLPPKGKGKGRVNSPEAKARMSAAAQKRWDNQKETK